MWGQRREGTMWKRGEEDETHGKKGMKRNGMGKKMGRARMKKLVEFFDIPSID